jgi:hypothetical protein
MLIHAVSDFVCICKYVSVFVKMNVYVRTCYGSRGSAYLFPPSIAWCLVHPNTWSRCLFLKNFWVMYCTEVPVQLSEDLVAGFQLFFAGWLDSAPVLTRPSNTTAP